MLELKICGDPILRKKSEPVKKVSKKIKKYIDEMFAIMDKNNGIGLAGPQAGILKRITVFNVSQENKKNIRIALVNPVIVKKSKDKVEFDEGCLSVPGVYKTVIRPESVVCEALDYNGKKISLDVKGLFARAIQHEIDHLDGKLFIDYLPAAERKEIETSFKKEFKF